jgi:tetratricopeptide (TPR) repeat protein
MALELRTVEGSERRELWSSLGDALANAGQGTEAAKAYLTAAENAPVAERIELLRRAAEQFLITGHIDDGLEVMRSVLVAVGMKLAATPRRALLLFLLRRAFLRLRGLRFRERDSSDVPAEELIRIDACYTVVRGMGMVDTIRAGDFQTRHLLLALKCGDPFRLYRALAMEAIYSAGSGSRSRKRSVMLLQMEAALQEKIRPRPETESFPYYDVPIKWHVTAGVIAYLEGRWKTGCEEFEEVSQILREQHVGHYFEVNFAQIYHMYCLYHLGELVELRRRIPEHLKEAQDRGDLWAETNLRTRYTYVVCYADDDPEGATDHLQYAMARWTQKGFHLLHCSELFARAMISLYRGNGEDAWNVLEKTWPAMARSLALRIQVVLINAIDFRARSAVAAATSVQEGRKAENLLRAAERDAQLIERERAPWGDALALFIRASVAATRGDKDKAMSLLLNAESSLGSVDMSLRKMLTRRCRGLLTGGDEGLSLVQAADQWMLERGVKNPARMANLAPGRWQL